MQCFPSFTVAPDFEAISYHSKDTLNYCDILTPSLLVNGCTEKFYQYAWSVYSTLAAHHCNYYYYYLIQEISIGKSQFTQILFTHFPFSEP